MRRATSSRATARRDAPSAVRASIARQKRRPNAPMRRATPGTEARDGFEDHYQNTAAVALPRHLDGAPLGMGGHRSGRGRR
eukprot:598374-Pyramimonas_sp.AAC.1